MTYKRRTPPKPDPFWVFFKAAMGVLLALVAVATLFAGGCCGILVGVAKSAENRQQEETR